MSSPNWHIFFFFLALILSNGWTISTETVLYVKEVLVPLACVLLQFDSEGIFPKLFSLDQMKYMDICLGIWDIWVHLC